MSLWFRFCSVNDSLVQILFGTNDSLVQILFGTNDSLVQILFGTNDSLVQILFGTNDSLVQILFSTNDPLVQVRYLRNKFDFWNVHELMNTSRLLQSSEALGFSLILYVPVNSYGHFMYSQFT